jgi:hypothetical protein
MTVNHHQRKVLHAIFAHPINANLEMKDVKDVVNVLNGLGAEIDAKSKSRLGVTLMCGAGPNAGKAIWSSSNADTS